MDRMQKRLDAMEKLRREIDDLKEKGTPSECVGN